MFIYYVYTYIFIIIQYVLFSHLTFSPSINRLFPVCCRMVVHLFHWMDVSLFVFLFPCWHLGLYPLLAVMNKMTVKVICRHGFPYLWVFIHIYPWVNISKWKCWIVGRCMFTHLFPIKKIISLKDNEEATDIQYIMKHFCARAPGTVLSGMLHFPLPILLFCAFIY